MIDPSAGPLVLGMICLIGIMWAFGMLDGPEGYWVWPAKVILTARWTPPRGTPDIDVFLEMDADRIKIGRE